MVDVQFIREEINSGMCAHNYKRFISNGIQCCLCEFTRCMILIINECSIVFVFHCMLDEMKKKMKEKNKLKTKSHTYLLAKNGRRGKNVR